MRTADYKKRAALAAENWERLQIQEQTEKNGTQKEGALIEKSNKISTREKSNPVTLVKGIKISEKVIKKTEPQELRDTA